MSDDVRSELQALVKLLPRVTTEVRSVDPGIWAITPDNPRSAEILLVATDTNITLDAGGFTRFEFGIDEVARASRYIQAVAEGGLRRMPFYRYRLTYRGELIEAGWPNATGTIHVRARRRYEPYFFTSDYS